MEQDSKNPEEAAAKQTHSRDALVRQAKTLLFAFDTLKTIGSITFVAALVGLGLFLWLGEGAINRLLWAVPLGIAALSMMALFPVMSMLEAVHQRSKDTP